MTCLTERSDIVTSFLSPESALNQRPASGSGLYELDIERNGDLVTNENAASLKRRVPGQAEVFPVDLGRRRGRDPGIAPGILRWRGWPFKCKGHLAGNAPDGQVAVDLQFSFRDNFDVAGFERQAGKLLNVQEVGALEVRVALRFAGFNRGRFNQCLDARLCRVPFSVVEDSSDFGEMPLHVGNHHVFDLEFGGRVCRVNVPGGG